MESNLVQEIASLGFEVGQAAGFVSPSIQKAIRTADARAMSPELPETQRVAFAKVATFARVLGGLQIFQAVTDDPKKRNSRNA